MGSIGWAPIRHDWRPCKKRILGYTEGQPREVTEKTAVCQRLGLRGGPSPPCHRGLWWHAVLPLPQALLCLSPLPPLCRGLAPSGTLQLLLSRGFPSALIA